MAIEKTGKINGRKKEMNDAEIKNLGMTALHYAAKGGNLEVVKVLIRDGADPFKNPKNVMKFLLENGADPAKAKNPENIMNFLLENGADPAKAKNQIGYASEVIRLLLEYGADPNWKEKQKNKEAAGSQVVSLDVKEKVDEIIRELNKDLDKN